MNAKLSKAYDELIHFIDTADCSYNSESKNAFAKKGKAFLTLVSEEINFDEVKIHFNPGGVAVWGDVTLMGMKGDKGIHIYVTESGMRWGLMYRSIADMKDYRGGSNNWCHKEGAESFMRGVRRILDIR